MNSDRPRCVGCGKTDTACGEYGYENPVEEDGTYADGKFVCTNCYMQLIPLGLSAGGARAIQARVVRLKKKGVI